MLCIINVYYFFLANNEVVVKAHTFFNVISIINTTIIVNQNVVFEKNKKIATTRSKWIVATFITLDPYDKLLTQLSQGLNVIGLVREKRALLPIVGKALSFLFDTLDEDDLTVIRNNIQTLANNQIKIKHLIKNSLTITEATQRYTKQNRDTINKVIEFLNATLKHQQTISREIKRKINTKKFMLNLTVRLVEVLKQ